MPAELFSSQLLRGSARVPRRFVRQCFIQHSLRPLPSVLTRPFSSTPCRPAGQPPSSNRDWASQLSSHLRSSSAKPTPPENVVPPPPPPPPPPQSRSSGAAARPATSRFIYDAVQPGGGNLDIASIVTGEADDYVKRRFPVGRPKRDIRLTASTGRTAFVKPGSGFAGAVRTLQRMCATNKLRRLQSLQRFHERPGLKRKRLKGERWRARFKKGFEAACKRVLELNKQGW